MKKLFSFITIVTFICIFASISYGAHYWAKAYGNTNNNDKSDYAHSIQQTNDGGYIVAGRTDWGCCGRYNDIWILKLDDAGAVQWQKAYGSQYAVNDYTYSIQQTGDGGYIIAGLTVVPEEGANIWVLKLNDIGDIQWQKTFGGTEHDQANTVQQTNDDGYIVVGHTPSFGAGESDIWILKLDSNGTVQWQKTYGGISHDNGQSIQQTNDNGYIVVGHTESFGEGASDIWVLKLDDIGNVQWQKTYGGIYHDQAYEVQQTSDGGYIVGGRIYYEAGLTDAWALKLDSSGNVQWQKAYGGTDRDEAKAIRQTNDGGFIVAGQTYFYGAGDEDFWILKLDSNGGIQWQKKYGGGNGESAASIQQTNDGYIVAGHGSPSTPFYTDVMVLKIDSNGNLPECDIIGTTDALITETTVVGKNTSITANDTSAIIHNTSISPLDTSCDITVICFDDGDAVMTSEDNCPETYNPYQEDLDGDIAGDVCDNCPDTPNQDQLDSYPLGGNGIGDACDCEGNFNCSQDQDVDGSDASTFKSDFGRNSFQRPCISEDACNGDFNCDGDVDGTDASLFKQDFGRSSMQSPCPACEAGAWCTYN